MRVGACALVLVNTYIHIHTHTYTYTHTHIHTYTYTHTHTHTHTHTCTYTHIDNTIPPGDQQSLAHLLRAHTLKYEGMSHVGPLLATRASEVARDVIEWLHLHLYMSK